MIKSRHLMRSFVVPLILVLSLTSAVAARRERTIGAWRPVHYTVDLTLNEPLTEIVSARVALQILVTKPTRLIDLDFGEMTTSSVKLDGSDVPFVHKDGMLQVKPEKALMAGSRITLTISYRGKPKDGLILTRDKDGEPSAVGDNWPNRLHHWIPSLDHPSAKATVTFNITTSMDDLVVANGRLDKVKTASTSTRTWTYTETAPIPPYCMIIAVGDFAKLPSLTNAVTPLSYYVPKSDTQHAQTGFAPSAPALDLFSQLVAPYPYEKLAMIVGATRFGGMENSSAILFTQTLFDPKPDAKISKTFGIPSGTVTLIAHEIAHQWFGDSVTESTWSDLWLSEGFATYFAGLFMKRHDGEDAFREYMQKAAESYFAYEEKKSVPIFDPETENLLNLLNANNYQKGAWVLHMLHQRLGDDLFFRGIQNYYQRHKNGIASTEDLRAAMEQTSGKNLREFFARWIYDSGHPEYELEWESTAKKGSFKLTLNQVQRSNAFLDPVPIVVRTADGVQNLVIEPTGKQTVKLIQLGGPPLTIEVDPANTLLREVKPSKL